MGNVKINVNPTPYNEILTLFVSNQFLLTVFLINEIYFVDKSNDKTLHFGIRKIPTVTSITF